MTRKATTAAATDRVLRMDCISSLGSGLEHQTDATAPKNVRTNVAEEAQESTALAGSRPSVARTASK
jgi:hypothetical protein